MNAADVVGYTYDGIFYCLDCWEGAPDDETGVVFAGSEWDDYPTCDTCGETCEDVSLTSEGEAYEREYEADDDTDDDTDDDWEDE